MITTVTLNPSLDEWLRLPRLRLGELNRAEAFQRYPGGKGINVARVCHELGEAAMAVAMAGGDDGKILGALLTQQGIPYRFVTVQGTTRNNYQIHTKRPPTLTQINCAGPRVSASALDRLERLLCRLQRRSACMVLSGSLPPGAPSTTYHRLIRTLSRRRMLTVLDTSGSALKRGLSARPWLIKPNRAEAKELLGMTLRRIADVGHAARHLAQRGPSVVIISLGPDGAVLAAKDQSPVWWARPPRARVQSTVGAGDSLVAGCVIGWLKTRSLLEALRLGMACGVASVMTPGTELCHADDVKRLQRRITMRIVRGA